MKKVDSYLVLLLAGKGERLSSAIKEKKQFYLVDGKPLFSYSLEVFKKTELFKKYILVVAKEDIKKTQDLLIKKNLSEDVILVEGGASRNQSVCSALIRLQSIASSDDKIFIHDAARPIISEKLIFSLYERSLSLDGLTPVKRIHDSVISKDKKTYINRDDYYLVLTPQVFSFSKILMCYKNYDDSLTDDYSKMDDRYKKDILLTDDINLKVTDYSSLLLFLSFVKQKTD